MSQNEGRDLHGGADELRIVRPQHLRRALDDECGAVVERVRKRGGRLDPVDAEVERGEERRRRCERMDRGADVVPEPRERELRGARAAADRVLRLDDEDGASGLREGDCGREPVRAGADDDRV